MPPAGGDPLVWRVSAETRDGGVRSNTGQTQTDLTLIHANAPVVCRGHPAEVASRDTPYGMPGSAFWAMVARLVVEKSRHLQSDTAYTAAVDGFEMGLGIFTSCATAWNPLQVENSC